MNKAAYRQTHATIAPFQQATSIPKDTYKSVLDTWEGYHSTPLDQDDKKKTCFITPFGRYQYKCAPMGFVSSGDAYTRRYDQIIEDFDNVKKVVDDILLYDKIIREENFRTCQYLTLCSKNGIIFNKKKFVFCQKEVDFAGFVISTDSVRPAEKFLEAIKNFPAPKDLTGIRSWFGLVNQVSYALANSDVMLLFRSLLKPSSEFVWTKETQEAFENSKDVIIEQVKEGVRTFDVSRTTCLSTDWSKEGIGFVLLQKYCQCKNITPICCTTGWKLVSAASRYNSQAELRYAPVEGELLAVAQALKKSKYFVLGNKNLVVAVDHKPLLGVLSDKEMDNIDNPRLYNLKEKTLRYRFSLVHVPGKNTVPLMLLPGIQSVTKTTWRYQQCLVIRTDNREAQRSLYPTSEPRPVKRILKRVLRLKKMLLGKLSPMSAACTIPEVPCHGRDLRLNQRKMICCPH